MGDPDAIVSALAEQHAELAGLLGPLQESDWERPSPCVGWTVADVVLHLAQTDEMAIASARGQLGGAGHAFRNAGEAGESVDDVAALAVARERGQPGAAVRDRWQTGAAELREVLAASDPHTRVTWVAGELSVRTLAATRIAETWIHTTDVAEALDITLPPPDRLSYVARLAWRTLPYAFGHAGRELAGPVAFELTGPSGDRWSFVPEGEPVTTIRGDGVELCLVAARRVEPDRTSLGGEGPDTDAVLELIRTYA